MIWMNSLSPFKICLLSSVLGPCCAGFSLGAESGATLELWCTGSSSWRLLLVQSTVLGCEGFSSRGTWVSSCQNWALEHGFNSCGTQLCCSKTCRSQETEYFDSTLPLGWALAALLPVPLLLCVTGDISQVPKPGGLQAGSSSGGCGGEG